VHHTRGRAGTLGGVEKPVIVLDAQAWAEMLRRR
jgi:hypothetical protein